jgi:hypothetical protein
MEETMEKEKRTIITVAQSRGSAAKTKSGAWKYLLGHMPNPIRGLSAIGQGQGRHSDKCALDRWTAQRIERQADGRARTLGYPLQSEQWVWYTEAYEANRQWDIIARTAIGRDNYGVLFARSSEYFYHTPSPRADVLQYHAALDIVRAAQSSGVISPSYDSIGFDHKGRADGSALHYELFDFAEDAALVCARTTEGTRYGVKTLSKKYMLLAHEDTGIASMPTSEPVAKLAKTNPAWGSIIARIRGEEGAAALTSPLLWEDGYKALALADDGTLHSIYSGEEYILGKTMRERAVDNHGGGYYCYPTLEQALQCEVPSNSSMCDARRVVVLCEVAGRAIEYGCGKIARTYLRPVEIVASRL